MPKMTKQAIKTDQTRCRIISVATRLMRHDGFENTSIRQICDEANVSTGTFYHLFDSKTDLLNIILGEVNEFYSDCEFDYEKDSPYKFLDKLIENHLELLRYFTPTIVFNAFFEPTAGNKTMFVKQRSSTQFVMRSLEGFQKAGKIRKNVSIEQMYLELSSAYSGLLYTFYTLERMDEFAVNLRDFFYRLFSTFLTCTETEAPASE